MFRIVKKKLVRKSLEILKDLSERSRKVDGNSAIARFGLGTWFTGQPLKPIAQCAFYDSCVNGFLAMLVCVS